MPAAMAGKALAKSRLYWWRFRPDPRSRRECGPHIGRHPMGRCRCFLSQIVDGYTYYDTRRCGGPIGAIRSSQRLSSVIFHGFCPFSLRDAAQSLPRLLPRVDGLLWPFFVSGFAARGCPRVELRAKIPKKTGCGCGSRSSNLLARPLGPRHRLPSFEGNAGLAYSQTLILVRGAFSAATSSRYLLAASRIQHRPL